VAAQLRAEADAARLADQAAEAAAAAADEAPQIAAAVKPGTKPVTPQPQPQPRPSIAQPDQPEARKPQITIPPRPRPEDETQVHPVVEAKPGDIICGVCSMPNDPSRTFCRRCGSPLAAPPPPPARLPWYRRLFQSKPRAAAEAGTRPIRMGREGQPRPGIVRRVVPLLLIALIAFGITSFLIVPGVRDAAGDLVTDLRLRFMPTITDVHPTKVQGDGVGSNDGSLAIDDNLATFWLANAGDGVPTVTADMGATINLGGLVVHSGSTTESDFSRHLRPKVIELSFPGAGKAPVQVTLQDISEPQPITLDVRDVRNVVFKVIDFFPSAAGGDDVLAIREIEVKQRVLDNPIPTVGVPIPSSIAP
jgi:hypothetical protein